MVRMVNLPFSFVNLTRCISSNKQIQTQNIKHMATHCLAGYLLVRTLYSQEMFVTNVANNSNAYRGKYFAQYKLIIN